VGSELPRRTGHGAAGFLGRDKVHWLKRLGNRRIGSMHGDLYIRRGDQTGAGIVISLSSWLVSGRANFEPYGISPIGLSFTRPEQETEYQAFILKVTVAHIRFALATAMVIIALYGALDPLIYEERRFLVFALLVRFLVLFPASLLLLLTTFHPRYQTYARFAGTCGICAVGIGLCLMALRSNALTLIYTLPAIVMASVYSFFFVGLFFRYAIVAATVTNTIYVLAIWSADIPLVMAIAAGSSIFTILLMLTMAGYQKELISRQLFVSEMREREAIARQSHNDSRYLAWLRQLAQFLRHEVRQPVAQINSSIEIVELACADDDRLKPYLASAALGTQHVWNLVERASQATDAEAFVRQAQPRWTDLSQLLADQIDAYRQTNSGVKFSLQQPTTARVFADPTLIKEAIGNLLSNAASFAREESTVEVALDVDGLRADIKVSNQGPSIEGDTEELFGPFASTRAGPSSQHHGLGLYLVRLIAEQHGGAARICNLEDGVGVQATISLPLAT
jgi:signal transduction histidine kinase